MTATTIRDTPYAWRSEDSGFPLTVLIMALPWCSIHGARVASIDEEVRCDRADDIDDCEVEMPARHWVDMPVGGCGS